MCEGRREGSWGVKYLTDKGKAMALELLHLCKTRDVLEERVCVYGGIDVTACAYLRVYASVCMYVADICMCMRVCVHVCACLRILHAVSCIYRYIHLYRGADGHG